jgi:hypothetical protein
MGPTGAAGGAPATAFGGRDEGATFLVRPVRSELDCERGRVVDDASLGRVDTPFRALLLGAPDARFLGDMSVNCQQDNIYNSAPPLLDDVCFQ